MKNLDEYKDEELAAMEGNIVDALMTAANFRFGDNVQRKITIKRNGKVIFQFTIEPIDEDIWQKCRRQNTRNKGSRNEELDNARFLSQAIYEATIPQDKERLWKNPDVWKKFGVARGVDVVNLVLSPGEKAKIGDVLSEISGYGDSDLDDLIKNV